MAHPPPSAGPSVPAAQTPPPNSPPPAHAAFPTAAELGVQAHASGSSQSQGHAEGSSNVPTTAEELHGLMMTTITPQDISDKLIPILLTLTKLRNEQGGPDLLALDGVEIDTSDAALGALSLAYTAVITARILAKLKAGSQANEEDVSLALRLINVCDKRQLAMCLPLVSEFGWALLQSAKKANRVANAIQPLHSLWQGTSAPSPRKFNGVHAALLEAALITRQLQPAYPTLTPPYLSVDEVNFGPSDQEADEQGTSYLDVLTYHHHAGLVAAANGDFALATQMFTFAAAAPTVVASAIQLACVKRAILCELLQTGKYVALPKDTSSAVTRMLEKTIKDYKDLAKAFEAHEWVDVQKIAQSKKTVFTQDANWGLVQQILDSIPKRRILTLRPTYARIALADLARKVGLGDRPDVVKSVIGGMVASGEIRASVSGSPEIVTFDDDDDYDSPAAMQRMKEAQAVAGSLLADLTRADQQLGLNPKWLQKQVHVIEAKEKQKEAGGKMAEAGGEGLRVGGAVGSNQADFGF